MSSKIKKVILTSVALMSIVFGGMSVRAADSQWEKPTFVYGIGLNSTEVNEVADLLGIKSKDSVQVASVNGQDFQSYLGQSSPDSELISSVLVEKTGEGSGVKVDIVTPQNITLIASEQYSNAAITAGVSDVKIKVASIRPATGESALTGVYKALETNGETLDADRMQVAQEELETTGKIAEGMSAEQAEGLDAAMIEIKAQLQELVQQAEGLASREDIERIINDALAKYNLENAVSPEQVNQLIIFFNNFQMTDAINSDELKQQLSQLADRLGGEVQQIFRQAEESGLIDRIIQFFKEIWQAIFGVAAI